MTGPAVTVGSLPLFAGRGLAVSPALQQAMESAESAASTAVLVGWDGQARGVLVVADALKPGARDAVARIQRLGLRPVLLTGDHERTAQAVAAQLAIPAESVVAGVPPDGKAEVVRELQAAGDGVAVVGDGVNDAAALAQADLGMAIGTGTDAAIGAADLTLVSGDPAGIADAILLARATLRVIHLNLAWAFGYNVVVIPLAALGYLNPLFAGVAMSASSLIVVTNSLRLRRFQSRRSPRPQPGPPAARPGPPHDGRARGAPLGRRGARPPGRAGPGRGGAGHRRRAGDRIAVRLGDHWRGRDGHPDTGPDRLGGDSDARLYGQRGQRHPCSAYLPHHPQSQRRARRTGVGPHSARPPGAPHRAAGIRGHRPVVGRLAIPAHGSLTLTPLSADAVLEDPVRYETDMTVPLTLTFAHAGQVHVDAAVTAPGSP